MYLLPGFHNVCEYCVVVHMFDGCLTISTNNTTNNIVSEFVDSLTLLSYQSRIDKTAVYLLYMRQSSIGFGRLKQVRTDHDIQCSGQWLLSELQ